MLPSQQRPKKLHPTLRPQLRCGTSSVHLEQPRQTPLLSLLLLLLLPLPT